MSIENFGIYGSSERSTPTHPLRLLYNVSISADVRSLKKNPEKTLIVSEKMAKSSGSRAYKMMEVRSCKLSE